MLQSKIYPLDLAVSSAKSQITHWTLKAKWRWRVKMEIGPKCLLQQVAQHEPWFCSVSHWAPAVHRALNSLATHCCVNCSSVTIEKWQLLILLYSLMSFNGDTSNGVCVSVWQVLTWMSSSREVSCIAVFFSSLVPVVVVMIGLNMFNCSEVWVIIASLNHALHWWLWHVLRVRPHAASLSNRWASCRAPEDGNINRK